MIIKSVIDATAAVFRYLAGRSEANNEPDVKQSKKNQQAELAKDEVRKSISNQDVDAVRKLGSE